MIRIVSRYKHYHSFVYMIVFPTFRFNDARLVSFSSPAIDVIVVVVFVVAVVVAVVVVVVEFDELDEQVSMVLVILVASAVPFVFTSSGYTSAGSCRSSEDWESRSILARDFCDVKLNN